MRKVFAVIRREFVERVRTRVFIISTLLFPVFIATMFVLPAWLMRRDTGSKVIVIVDGSTTAFGQQVERSLAGAQRGAGPDAAPRYVVSRIPARGREIAVRDSLIPMTGIKNAASTDGAVDGILIVNDSALVSGRLQYYGGNVGSPDDMRDLREAVRPAVITQRLEILGVEPASVMRSVQGIALATTKVANGKLTAESGEATFFLAYGMGMILYISLLIFGTQVMNSIVEEKNNRIVEILSSSLTPFQMMLGKIVGVGSVALLQIGIWAGTATFISSNQTRIFGALGAGAGSGPMPFSLPKMNLDLLIVFLLFFALGFLIFAALYAAVGAMVNTTQEAGQAQFPVMMFVLAGFFSVFLLIKEPNGTAAQVLSYVPLLSPFVVPMRYSISPLPWPELLGSIAATVAGLFAVVWVASRIYRVGILMYGKRATFREVARWVRAS
jgi:ABC-2 type transport system permease protein